MRLLKLFIKVIGIALLPTLCACGQQNKKKPDLPNPSAHKLYDSAINYMMLANNETALKFLNSAVAIDSNYYQAFTLKFTLESLENKYAEALGTTKKIISLNPVTPYYFLPAGMLSEKVGDSSSAKVYYQRGINLVDQIVDTIKINSDLYFDLQSTKGLFLVFLNDPQGQHLLNSLYKNELYKERKAGLSDYVNKSKEEIFSFLFSAAGWNRTE